MTRRLAVSSLSPLLLLLLAAGCGGNKLTNPDRAPFLERIVDHTVESGDTLAIAVIVSDPDGDEVTVTVTGLPSWLTFDSTTRMITGRAPTTTVRSTVNVTVRATDTKGTSASDQFLVTVVPAGVPPPVTPPPSLDGTPPFGFLDAFGNLNDPNDAVQAYSELGGLQWARNSAGNAGGLHWSRAFMSFPDTFSMAESQVALQIANGITPLVNLDPVVPTACNGFAEDTRHYPCWPDSYTAWVQAAHWHLPLVKYFQVANEPMNAEWVDSQLNYARLVQLTAQALKPVCPDCKIVLAGMSESYLDGVLADLDSIAGGTGQARQNGWYDVADFHIFGLADTTSFLGGGVTYATTASEGASIRSTLNAHGAADVPIWITEIVTYTGAPHTCAGFQYPFQSERQQARNLVKRMAYPLANGVTVVLWAQIVDLPNYGGYCANYPDNYFSVTGLLQSDQQTPKLSLWTMQKLVEKLSQVTWKSLQEIPSEPNVVTLAAVDSLGRQGYLVWWDYINESDPPSYKAVTLQMSAGTDSILVTDLVPDGESGASVDPLTDFTTEVLMTSANNVATIALGRDPIFVEALPAAPRRGSVQAALRR